MFGCVDLQEKDQAEGGRVMPVLVMHMTGIGKQDWQKGAASCQEAMNGESGDQWLSTRYRSEHIPIKPSRWFIFQFINMNLLNTIRNVPRARHR